MMIIVYCFTMCQPPAFYQHLDEEKKLESQSVSAESWI